RDAEAAADVDDREVLEAARRLCEDARRVLPAGDVEDAAADVRLQPGHPGARGLREPDQHAQLRELHAELRARAGGAHVIVVTAPYPGVDAHEDGAVVEE